MTTGIAPKVRLDHTLRQQSERGPVIALAVFLAVLPLEWITVTPAAGGFIKPFHLAAIAFIVVSFARWRPGLVVLPMWRRHLPLFGSYLVLLGAAFAASIAYPDPYLAPTLIFRQGTYVVTALIIAGCVPLLIGRRAQRWLALSGIASALLLMAAFTYSMALQNTNPLTLIGRALAEGDPDIITYELLRTAFRTDENLAEVAASLRHKVFLGLLVGVFLGLACSSIIERRHRLLRGAIALGSGAGCMVALLSLSRSTILCLSVPFLLYPLRILVRNRARPSQAVAIAVAVAAGLAVLISPIGQLLFTRFSGSDSYTARLTAAGPGFVAELQGSALIGAARSTLPVGASPHNFVLNSWLAGGIVAGAAAAVMLFALGWLWLREAHRYLTDRPGWVVPVEQMWLLGLGVIPLVRFFTAGNQLHMVDLTAMALFVGIIFANERAVAAQRGLAAIRGSAAVAERRWADIRG